jgi:cytoskeleton protein RodZ
MLGADPAPLTQALRRERGVPEPDLSMPASAGGDLPRGRVSLTLGSGAGSSRRGSWLWGVAAVIVAVIGISMWHTNSGESSAWFSRLKAMANGAGAQPAAATSTVAEGQTTEAGAASGEQAAANGDATTAPAAVASAPAVTAQQTTTAAATSASASTTTGAPATTATPTTTASAPTVATAEAAPQGASNADATGGDKSTFAIRVTEDTWLSVRQKDGKEVFSGLIHGSDSREITGVEPLKVTVGNKAGIESMTIDGQPVDASKYASARGNVARFVLP